jgi:hypothetical protein
MLPRARSQVPRPTSQKAIDWVLGAPDMTGIAEAFLGNWFPKATIEADGPIVQKFREMLLTTPPHGLAGCLAALRDTDLRRVITLIKNPTLVLAGEFDTVTSAQHGKEIAGRIPGAKFQILPSVHLPNIEFPDEFLSHVLTFLSPEGFKPLSAHPSGSLAYFVRRAKNTEALPKLAATLSKKTASRSSVRRPRSACARRCSPLATGGPPSEC